MQEKVISFETAKLAKEKGFNVPVIYGYNELGKIDDIVDTDYGKNFEYQYDNINSRIISEEDILFENWKEWINYSAPNQSLLQKWLREVHSIEISIRAIKWENTELKTGLVLDSYEYEMYPLKKCYYIYHKVPGFKTYEEALEVGLQEALKLI